MPACFMIWTTQARTSDSYITVFGVEYAWAAKAWAWRVWSTSAAGTRSAA
jgi:hypothetical protein